MSHSKTQSAAKPTVRSQKAESIWFGTNGLRSHHHQQAQRAHNTRGKWVKETALVFNESPPHFNVGLEIIKK